MITTLTPFVLTDRVQITSLPFTRSTVFGVTDLRTSSTVFLFEESAPLDYCQQLSAGVQNKRTLASFFSLGKTKQRKQATTLNGCPYIVGHVPRSLNSCEAESEGLLHGNNSLTKVISFSRDGPVERDITHPESGLGGSSPSSSWRRTRPDISSPLSVAPREETTPCPSTPVIQTGI